jgi:hypothetical protein
MLLNTARKWLAARRTHHSIDVADFNIIHEGNIRAELVAHQACTGSNGLGIIYSGDSKNNLRVRSSIFNISLLDQTLLYPATLPKWYKLQTILPLGQWKKSQ